jgi:hypothetical protein
MESFEVAEHMENRGFLMGQSDRFDQFFAMYELGTDRAQDRARSRNAAGAHIFGFVSRSTLVWWRAVYYPK